MVAQVLVNWCACVSVLLCVKMYTLTQKLTLRASVESLIQFPLCFLITIWDHFDLRSASWTTLTAHSRRKHCISHVSTDFTLRETTQQFGWKYLVWLFFYFILFFCFLALQFLSPWGESTDCFAWVHIPPELYACLKRNVFWKTQLSELDPGVFSPPRERESGRMLTAFRV